MPVPDYQTLMLPFEVVRQIRTSVMNFLPCCAAVFLFFTQT